MPLFLTSSANKVLKVLPSLFKTPENKKVLFISNAADLESSQPWVDNDRNELVRLGYNPVVLDLRRHSGESLKHVFSNYKIIFVAGGNTFYLLDIMRKSGFASLISEFMNKEDTLYIGSSAGSVVAGKNIEVVEAEDPKNVVPDLIDYTGLTLVNFTVLPHFGEIDQVFLYKQEYLKSCPLITLSDSQYIFIDSNGKFEIDTV